MTSLARAPALPRARARIAPGGARQRRPRLRVHPRADASGSSSGSSSSSSSSVAALASAPPGEPPARLRKRLAREMAAAVAREDFASAAELRDALREAMDGDPRFVARRALRAAVADERYEDAARLRDELSALEPPPPPPLPPPESDVVTDGVRVRVLSAYVPARSDPDAGTFFFAYTVRVTNEGEDVVQLKRREWIILDAEGREERVEGEGVVGQQPVLRPGQTFEYASACPLRTPAGRMRGTYVFSRMLVATLDEDGSSSGEEKEEEEEEEKGRSREDKETSSGGPVGAQGSGGSVRGGSKVRMDEVIPGARVALVREGESAAFDVEVGEFGLDAGEGFREDEDLEEEEDYLL